MKVISVLGVDLAKNVFQLHGNGANGKTVLRKQLSRGKVLEFIAKLPPCLIGMESCSGSNYWAREFARFGHTVRQMAPQFVKPYVKSNKNDQNDAEAIAEAVVRPSMRFVPMKGVEHHDIQTIHRVRQRLVRNRTALVNEFHGLLIEYGVALSLPRAKLRQELRELVSPEHPILSPVVKETLTEMLGELDQLQERVEACDEKLQRIAKKSPMCERIQKIPGIGLITATGMIAAVPDARNFKNGRQFSAWLGLVPKQRSSGGKSVLLGISKRGDTYLRTMLIHGARSVLRYAPRKTDRLSEWAVAKQKTRGTNRAVVAVANKNARIVWALMSSEREYQAA